MKKSIFTFLFLSSFIYSGSSWGFEFKNPFANEASSKDSRSDVGIEEKLGNQLDFQIKVKEESGFQTRIGAFFDGRRPVIIAPVYYSCPGLCNLHLNGLLEAFKKMDASWTVGVRFRMLAISFDPRETPDVALQKASNYLKRYGRNSDDVEWYFLTAGEKEIKAITETLGFKYKWDEKTGEWAHASAAIVFTPEGKISKYLHGVDFKPEDIQSAVNDAIGGRISEFMKQIQYYCVTYDPLTQEYKILPKQATILASAAIVIFSILGALTYFWRKRKSKLT